VHLVLTDFPELGEMLETLGPRMRFTVNVGERIDRTASRSWVCEIRMTDAEARLWRGLNGNPTSIEFAQKLELAPGFIPPERATNGNERDDAATLELLEPAFQYALYEASLPRLRVAMSAIEVEINWRDAPHQDRPDPVQLNPVLAPPGLIASQAPGACDR
jgi:hypothetical protein